MGSPLQIIPVIDLMDGIVVHARRGKRSEYRPIETPLCKGASPHAVIEGLLGLHDFNTFYFADLDSLTGKCGQHELLKGLQRDYSNLGFWIDRGWPEEIMQGIGPNGVAVIGSESLDRGRLAKLGNLNGEFILSLDFMGDRLLGDEGVLENPDVWPQTLIIMSLARVGSDEGPDFHRLQYFRALCPSKRIIAAGGVRNADDLNRLDGMGVNGVLLASALHSGAVGSKILQNYA